MCINARHCKVLFSHMINVAEQRVENYIGIAKKINQASGQLFELAYTL